MDEKKLLKQAMKLRYSGDSDAARKIYTDIINNSELPAYKSEASQELASLDESLSKIKNDYEKIKEAKVKAKELNQVLLLTTCPYLEGYRIVKHYGLVFGEVIYRASFGSRLYASLDNMVSAMKFSASEMDGATGLISEAREYAIKKMQSEAIDRGANAIVGIDSESSLGNDIVHITIYGTAVSVEKI